MDMLFLLQHCSEAYDVVTILTMFVQLAVYIYLTVTFIEQTVNWVCHYCFRRLLNITVKIKLGCG